MKGFTNDFVILNDNTMVIDSLYSIDELKNEFNDLDVVIVDITNFEPESKKMSEAFFKLDISNDVNHFLDLINDKGGIDFLTGKEKERLFELSERGITIIKK